MLCQVIKETICIREEMWEISSFSTSGKLTERKRSDGREEGWGVTEERRKTRINEKFAKELREKE